MNMEEEIMFLKERQAFWKGVVAGILGSPLFGVPSKAIIVASMFG